MALQALVQELYQVHTRGWESSRESLPSEPPQRGGRGDDGAFQYRRTSAREAVTFGTPAQQGQVSRAAWGSV